MRYDVQAGSGTVGAQNMGQKFGPDCLDTGLILLPKFRSNIFMSPVQMCQTVGKWADGGQTNFSLRIDDAKFLFEDRIARCLDLN